MVHESCMLYKKHDRPWQRGQSWLGGTFRLADGSPNQRHIRALDIQTGETVWNYAQTGDSTTYSGVLSTAGGLVFFGEDSGAFAALDAETGDPLWHFQANQDWKALLHDVHGRRQAIRGDSVRAGILGVFTAGRANIPGRALTVAPPGARPLAADRIAFPDEVIKVSYAGLSSLTGPVSRLMKVLLTFVLTA